MRAVGSGFVDYIARLGTIVAAVIDLHIRPRMQWALQPLGRALARLGVTPQFLTFVGLAITVAGATIIGTGRLRLGAIVALLGSALDGLDGSVARAAGTASARGALTDAVSDRIGEVATFAGLAVAFAGNARVLLLIVLSLGGSMLVPYLRAKAEAEGLDGRGGLMGRAERVLLVTVGLLTLAVEPMLWVLVVATWATVVWRFRETFRQLTT
ncbi:MAG TPA: CDP-alcohol phosphatidyltransferase family protein [Acidimicrobiia bacterium]|nr:CDP-alcohol phosphatidyltransferase family protein [Acidimicrobiia bacterium]